MRMMGGSSTVKAMADEYINMIQSFILESYLRWRDLLEVDMRQTAQEAGRRMM